MTGKYLFNFLVSIQLSCTYRNFCRRLCPLLPFRFFIGWPFVCSVPMDEEEKVVLDYTSDKLIVDGNFQKSILSCIAGAGKEIEDLYGSPQDIEGVVKEGKIYVVQTRPQM